jgi:toxin ParE1/3/4
MMARVIRSASAKADVLAIAEYIAADKPSAAERWVTKLEKTLGVIAEYPMMGESVDHLAPGMRRHCFGNYLLFYSRSMAASTCGAYYMAPAKSKICSDNPRDE